MFLRSGSDHAKTIQQLLSPGNPGLAWGRPRREFLDFGGSEGSTRVALAVNMGHSVKTIGSGVKG